METETIVIEMAMTPFESQEQFALAMTSLYMASQSFRVQELHEAAKFHDEILAVMDGLCQESGFGSFMGDLVANWNKSLAGREKGLKEVISVASQRIAALPPDDHQSPGTSGREVVE